SDRHGKPDQGERRRLASRHDHPRSPIRGKRTAPGSPAQASPGSSCSYTYPPAIQSITDSTSTAFDRPALKRTDDRKFARGVDSTFCPEFGVRKGGSPHATPAGKSAVSEKFSLLPPPPCLKKIKI